MKKLEMLIVKIVIDVIQNAGKLVEPEYAYCQSKNYFRTRSIAGQIVMDRVIRNVEENVWSNVRDSIKRNFYKNFNNYCFPDKQLSDAYNVLTSIES